MSNLSIRVDNGNRTIEVNDSGETILLKLGDESFIAKLENLVSKMLEKTTNVKSDEEARKAVEPIRQEMLDGIIELFGANSIKKIFGDVEPHSLLILDFLFQLIPFVEEFTSKREAIYSKYSPKRKGNAK